MERAGSLRELFSIAASARFDIGFSDNQRGKERDKERGRESEKTADGFLETSCWHMGDVQGTEKFRA